MRIHRLGLEFVTLASIAVALGMGAAPAHANTGSIALTDSSGLKYFVNDAITFSTTSSASGAASEASYTMAVHATTMNGGTSSTTLNDMFDGYGTMAVSFGATVPSTGPQTGNAAFIIYNKNGAATLDTTCANRQAIFPAQTMTNGTDTLSVQRLVFVPANDTFIRWVNVFTNTGSASATFQVGTGNNLGSDSNTIITATSDGNLTADATDSWAASMQDYSGTSSSDVRIGHVFQSTVVPGTPVAALHFVNGDDNPYWWYTLTLGAGQTAVIMTYATGQPTKAAAAAKATAIADQADTHMLDCLSATQLSQVKNFALQCQGPGAEGASCDDGDKCTTSDSCHLGRCAGAPKACRTNAGDCTHSCDENTGSCVASNMPDGAACSDGDQCNGDDTCKAGVCKNTGTAPHCDDHNPCTTDTCIAATGCSNAMMHGCKACGTGEDAGTEDAGVSFPECNDHNVCNGAEMCASDGTCSSGTSLNCDDGNPCTVDSCKASGGCQHTAIASCMNCVTAADCDDGKDCTQDSCVAEFGCVHNALTTGTCAGTDAGTGVGLAGNKDAGLGNSGGPGADGGAGTGRPTSKSDSGCGCSTAGSGDVSTAGLWLMALAWIARRRRTRS